MLVRFWNNFTKITAWPVQKLCFRTKIIYENKDLQDRNIKGPAIIISNHTSVYDYAVFLFVFYSRTLRYQMAELLFKKPLLGIYLKLMGGIIVDRDIHNFSFMAKSQEILDKGGIVGIFPESRLPKEGEQKPLAFKPSAAYLAIMSGAQIIPVFTDGSYFNSKRAHVIIGEPVDVPEILDSSLSEKENIDKLTVTLRQKIIDLEKVMYARLEDEKK